MGKRRVTMTDIARELGVSVSVVSLVLAGKAREHRISERLAEEVKIMADRMGYRINQLARGLRTGRSGLIGLIVADISNPYFGQMARLIENQAFSLGYQLVTGSSDEQHGKLRQIGEVLVSRQVDALIVVPVFHADGVLRQLARAVAPTVLIDRYAPVFRGASFCGHHYDGGYRLTKWLLDQGYRNPVAMTLDTRMTHHAERIRGFKKALARLKGTENTDPHVWLVRDRSPGRELEEHIDRLRHFGVDAVFFVNHMIAVEALKIFQRKGIRIPEDLGVVSFDDPEVFELHQPGITCYRQPLETICDAAMERIHLLFAGEDVPRASKFLFKGELIVRASTRKQPL